MSDFVFNIPFENSVKWDNIGNIKEARKNLGEVMPVSVYRLFQYTIRAALEKQMGTQSMITVLRDAGDSAGREFARSVLNLNQDFDNFIAQLQQELQFLKIGLLRTELVETDTGRMIITVDEDLDCSGLPVTGKTVCNYDEGFIAGILKEYTGKRYEVRELECWATGARICRFEATIPDE